jgi:hypothetical protein
MTDEPEVKEDPAPELKIVPIEDLDKIEKLLDVAINCVQTPNLPAIKAACMQELVEIDRAMAEQQEVAQEEYRVAIAEWDAKRVKKMAEEQKKIDEENAKRDKAARERGYPDTIAGSPRDTLAMPRDPSGPRVAYPDEKPPQGSQLRPGTASPYPSNPPPKRYR